MDIITNNYFNKFVKEHAITGKNVETNFYKLYMSKFKKY
jgi:hypothetical protein